MLSACCRSRGWGCHLLLSHAMQVMSAADGSSSYLPTCRIDVTSNLFFDSYGGSSPVYTNVYLINAATPSGATVRRSHPSTFKVQGWGYPATGSWYYLG